MSLGRWEEETDISHVYMVSPTIEKWSDSPCLCPIGGDIRSMDYASLRKRMTCQALNKLTACQQGHSLLKKLKVSSTLDEYFKLK